jgi:hypothetical protein
MNKPSEKIIICCFGQIGPQTLERFMKQIKHHTIVIPSSINFDKLVHIYSMSLGIRIIMNKRYEDIVDDSLRVYNIFHDEMPSKIYILDDEYESNIDKYKFINYIKENVVEIIVIKGKYFG